MTPATAARVTSAAGVSATTEVTTASAAKVAAATTE